VELPSTHIFPLYTEEKDHRMIYTKIIPQVAPSITIMLENVIIILFGIRKFGKLITIFVIIINNVFYFYQNHTLTASGHHSNPIIICNTKEVSIPHPLTWFQKKIHRKFPILTSHPTIIQYSLCFWCLSLIGLECISWFWSPSLLLV